LSLEQLSKPTKRLVEPGNQKDVVAVVLRIGHWRGGDSCQRIMAWSPRLKKLKPPREDVCHVGNFVTAGYWRAFSNGTARDTGEER
jgi:hypothetical protein